MEVHMLRHAGCSLGVAAALALACAGPAAANGYCGADPTGPTACPVPTNTTVAGAISSNSENDYYVFYVAHQTVLQLTINDSEAAQCSTSLAYSCGNVQAGLLDSRGNQVTATDSSSPQNGIAVPESVTKTIGRGIYYVAVSGFVAPYTMPSIPYQLTVDGNPAVQWPPACIVPRLKSKTTLARAKQRVRNNRCTVGVVHRVRSKKPRGDVVRLRPGVGSVLPYGARVTIYVSGHPKARRHHKARHHRK
jgi:hypothetical protein